GEARIVTSGLSRGAAAGPSTYSSSPTSIRKSERLWTTPKIVPANAMTIMPIANPRCRGHDRLPRLVRDGRAQSLIALLCTQSQRNPSKVSYYPICSWLYECGSHRRILFMILVTGGAGYIGSHAVKALRQSGFKAVIFDNFSTGHRSFLKDTPCVEGDVCSAV